VSNPSNSVAQPAEEKAKGVNPWLVLALIGIPVFVGSLDLTIVSAFLPEVIVSLQLPIQTSLDDAAWIVTGYLLAYTIGMTFMGRISDLAGRRSVYVVCLVIFMVGSFIVAEVDSTARQGLANIFYSAAFRITGERPDAAQIALITIIFGRVVQAFGAGAIVPVSLALVGDLFPAAKRAQPLGLVGAVDTLGWVLGHLYGGYIVALLKANETGIVGAFASVGWIIPPPDWRWLFWINIPLSLVALVATLWALRNVPQLRNKEGENSFDWLGTVLIITALMCLTLGLGARVEVGSGVSSFEEVSPLPPYALPVLLAGAAAFVAFIFVEQKIKVPLLQISLFRQRNAAMGSLTNLFVGYGIFVGLVIVPILVNIRLENIEQLQAGALEAGVLLSALTVPMALAAVPGGWLTDRFGIRSVTAGGMALAATGFVWVALTWSMDIAEALVAVQMATVGIGLGLTFSPISAAVINSATESARGSASAVVVILRLIGMTLSTSTLTVISLWRVNTLGAEQGIGALAASDTAAYIQAYSGIVVRVLAELGWLAAGVCLIGLVTALLMRDTDDSGARIKGGQGH
jgi:MFS family permease